ncbi:unnamed protein product, partial [Prorocentrum cordatum]
VYEEYYKIELKFANRAAAYIVWAMQRTLRVGKWEPEFPDVMLKPVGVRIMPAQVTSHDVAKLSDDPFVCRQCAKRTASNSKAAWNPFLKAPCQPTRLDALRAEAMVEYGCGTAYQISEAGRFVMEALDAAATLEDPGDVGEKIVSEWADAE